MKHLFLVVLGGRIRGCHVEQHDVRWVVGNNIEETVPTLKKEWIGLKSGLHIDSYRCIRQVDGYQIKINMNPKQHDKSDNCLWFVNIGGYSAQTMAEQHHFGLLVAKTAQQAKCMARKRWLIGMDQIHKDDLHSIDHDQALDDLLPINGNNRWSIQLLATDSKKDQSEYPDWYGYWKI